MTSKVEIRSGLTRGNGVLGIRENYVQRCKSAMLPSGGRPEGLKQGVGRSAQLYCRGRGDWSSPNATGGHPIGCKQGSHVIRLLFLKGALTPAALWRSE